jgi:phosphoserine phosphatase RsbU/P
MMMVLLRRLVLDRQEKQRLAGEFEAARVVQQLMLSSRDEPTANYTVEAVYRPAQEVGGDFYYLLRDGDALVMVTGDVSGKGLKAAMLVALLIGALRETSQRFASGVLSALNAVAMGQTYGGFATCVCARFDTNGTVTLASAGHLQPYLKGRELVFDSGLPLGISEETEYAESSLELKAGECLTFVSDGVLEAMNAKGELFGFDRTRDVSKKSAQQISDAACALGADR